MAGRGASGGPAPPRGPMPKVRYQLEVGGPTLYWSPASRANPCRCSRDYAYPNHVVFAVVRERKTLARTVERANAEIEELRAENERLRARIQELEGVADRFVRLSDTVRDCTAGIMANCEAMIEDIVEIHSEGQGGESSSVGQVSSGHIEDVDYQGDREASPTYSPLSDPSEDPDFPTSP